MSVPDGKPVEPLLYSKRMAARALCIDRYHHLERLIRDGHIKTVNFEGHIKITREELLRFCREGIPALPSRLAPPHRQNQYTKRKKAAPLSDAEIKAELEKY